MTDSPYQSRYIAYACAHGSTPEAMMEDDRAHFPGGVMTAYMLWMRAQWREWRELRGRNSGDCLSAQDIADFDAWLLRDGA